jgi:hypothetical protein
VAKDPIHVLLVEGSPPHADLIKEALAAPRGSVATDSAFHVVHVERLADALAHLDAGGVSVVVLEQRALSPR